MPYGPGLSPDSVGYLKAASGLLNGKGINYFTSQWPPLYPIMIAVVSQAFNNDVLKGAQVLQSLLYMTTFIGTVLLIFKTTKINKYIAIAFSLILCLQGTVTYIQYYVWSESLFITLILINILIIIKYLERKTSSYFLFAALITISALLCYTRYIGYSFAIGNGVVIFLLSRDQMTKKIILVLIQILIPLFLILPWLQYRSTFEDANTSMTFVFQGFNLEKFKDGFANIGRWIVPNNIGTDYDGGGPIFQIVGAGVLYFIAFKCIRIMCIKNNNREGAPKDVSKTIPIFAIGMLVLVYLASLVFFILYLTAQIKFENRYLVVVYIPIIIIILILSDEIKNKALAVSAKIIIVLFLLVSLPETKQRMLVSYHNGIELNANSHRQKPIYQFIKNCSKDLNVVADSPWNFDMHFINKVIWLPSPTYYGTNKKNFNFEMEIEKLKDKYDLIVIENTESTVIPMINTNLYNLVFNKDGMVWVSSRLLNHGCASVSLKP
jgi:hypothetical protein